MIGKIETVDSIVWTVTDPSSITEDYTNAATAVGRPVVAPVAAAVPAAPAQAAAVGAAVVAPAAAVAAVAPAQAAAAAPVAPAIVAAAPAADEPFLAFIMIIDAVILILFQQPLPTGRLCPRPARGLR